MNDKINPYSYKEWLALQSGNLNEDLQTLYVKYLKNWYFINNTKAVKDKDIAKQEYLQLVKDISYLFNREERDRFLKDINYENPEELIYAIPYFAKKLKEIAKVLNAKRNSVKKAKLKYNLVGSNDGLNSLLYEYILKGFTQTQNSITQIPASRIKNLFPSLSTIKNDFFIEIEELYDTNTYYDSDPTVSIENYTNIGDFFKKYPFEDLTEEEIYGILQTRFIPRVANNPLSKVYQSYLISLSTSNIQIEDGVETFSTITITPNNSAEIVPIQIAANEKYLGERIYGLTAIRLKDLNLPDQTITLNLEKGNNWFNWPSGNKITNIGLTDNFLRPIPINESNLVKSGATGGRTLETSDLIFTDQNGIVEGAWLQGFRTVTEKTSTFVKIEPNSVREFIYPYVGFSITTKGLNWVGHTLNDATFENLDILPNSQKKELLENYYTKTLPPSTSNPIYLNQTNLIERGAYAGEFSSDADVLIKRKNTPILETVYSDEVSENQTDIAFLYKFQKTDLPIAQGINQIYWPITTFDSGENTPLTVKNDFAAPIRLGALNVSQTMPGAVAGFSFTDSDVIYKLNARTSEPIEAAWLGAASINNLNTDSRRGIQIYNTDAVKCAKYIDGPIQPSLSFVNRSLEKVSFIWADVDTPADEVFKHYQHAPDCPYGKNYPHDYYGDQNYTNPTQLNETNFWSTCKCKSINYSPIGHVGEKYSDYQGITDLLFADPDALGADFAFNSWSDTRGLPPSKSPQFAFFKLKTGGDYPIGWGNGTWKTGSGQEFILKTGRRYTYYRTSLRKDNTSSTANNGDVAPYFVISYPYKELNGAGACGNAQNCFDMIIVLDVSNSQKLSLTDTKTIVKYLGEYLLLEATGDSKVQIGLVAFNQDAVVVSYLTKEYGNIDFNLQAYTPPSTFPEFRTNIEKGLTLAESLLFNKVPPDAGGTLDIVDLCRNLNAIIIDPREYAKIFNFPQNCGKKILLISDGDQNVFQDPTFNLNNVNQSTHPAVSLASTIKKKGVEIYSVDSGLLSKDNNVLEDIATAPSYYYDLQTFLNQGEGDAFAFSQKLAATIIGCASVVPKWNKAIRSNDGSWIGLNDPSDMILNPGDYLIYVHQGNVTYESEDLNSGFVQTAVSFTVNVKLDGWNYQTNTFDPNNIGSIYGAKPFWGKSYLLPDEEIQNEKEINYFGGAVRFINEYVPIRQPEVSDIVIDSGNYIQYFRRQNTSLRWIQPITLSCTLSDHQWKKISFEKDYFHLEDILRNGQFTYYGEATNEPSDIRLESFSDFRAARYNYFAQKTFNFNEELYNLERCDNSFVVFQTGSVLTPVEPYLNLLNVHYPTVATVNSTNVLVSEKQFGGYLTPINLGVSYYRGRGYSLEIDPNQIAFFDQINGERLFLDPNKYAGRNRGLSRKDQLSPVSIKNIDNRWLVESFNAGERAGMMINTQENQKMVPYQTYYEITNRNNSGISRQTDLIDFWTNTNPVLWNDEKNYPLTFRKDLEASVFELRKKGLLVNKGKIVQWRTDIFGNDIGLFKGTASQSLLPTEYLVGENSTYVGFGASTGALNNEHWIHDFRWTSEFNNVDMTALRGNSNFIGDATKIGNSIRLTQALNGQAGNLFHNIPVFISNSLNELIDWSAYFVFSMGGGTRADGISFILQSNNVNSGGGGFGLGYVWIPKSIAVGYDTFNNSGNDPNNNHIELDVNGDVLNPLLVQPNPTLDLCGTTGTNAYRYNWIDYVGATKTLKVYISNTSVKPTTPVMSYVIDISNYVLAN